MKVYFAGVCLAALTASLMGGTAAAQVNTAQAPSADTPTSGDVGIQDIIVTAQRRRETLQRAAVAVSAVNAEALVNAGVSQPQDLTKLVPALKLSAVGGAGTQITIRGVGNFAGNAYAEPAVAINLDGVYLARSGGPNGLFYDLERVEVLKGPQGTLYGRNATAGAINIITRKPDDQFSVEGTGEAGNYDLWRGVLAVNAPLAEGIALRVSGTISRRDGYLSDGYLDDKTEAVRGQLKLEPTSGLSILLSADYAHQGGKGPAGVLSPYLDPDNPYLGPSRDGTNDLLRGASLAISGGTNPDLLPPLLDDGFVDVKNWGVSGTIDYDFGGAKLTLIPAYRESKNRYLHYNAGFPVLADEQSKATSIEARLSSDGDAPLSWMVGGYYFNEDLDFDLYANQGIAFNRTEPILSTRSYAAFGQATYSLTDQFRVTGGLRYTHERKSQAGRNGGPTPPVPVGFPGPDEAFYAIACAPYDAATASCYAPLTGELTNDKVTWKAGVEFDAAPRSLLYANVATGFKAGGFYGSLPPNTFRPETITAYTVGSKNRFLNNSLQLNAEAFYWDYKDKQVTHIGPILPGGFNLITENAGKAEIYGAEIEAVWQPTETDTLTANVQYLHSKYKNFAYTQTTETGPPQTACPVTPIAGQAAVIVDCSGRPVPLSPKWTANISYRHSFLFDSGAKLDAQVGTRIESFYWVAEEYLPGERQKSAMVSNASLTWHAPQDSFSLGAWIDNIEDRTVKSLAFAQPVIGQPVVILRPPRTYGVRAGFKF
ncbi:MAG: TonB-dependent receptor [Sphingobium sp. 66-54]|nr:MAG: TonB-dependent receptor [Sphingobium sp. 66-54]